MEKTIEKNRRIAPRWRAAWLAVLVLVCGVLAFGPAHSEAQGDPDHVAVNRDMTVEKDRAIEGDVSVTNGNLTVYGTVDGDVAVVNGGAVVEGQIDGNLAVLVNGGVTLGKGAEVTGNVIANGDIVLAAGSSVRGDVTSVGGKVVRDPDATVGGTITAPGISLNGVSNQVVEAPTAPEPAPPAQPHTPFSGSDGMFDRFLALVGQGMISLVLLVVGALMAALLPRRIGLSSATLEAEPGPSIVVGLITGFLLVPVIVLAVGVLFITVIGILFIPVLVIAAGLLWLFGLVTVGAWLGRRIYEATHQGAPRQAAPPLMLLVVLGMAVLLGTTLLPSVLSGGVVVKVAMAGLVLLAGSIGLGSAILSRFGTLVPPRHAHLYGGFASPRVPYASASQLYPSTQAPAAPPAAVANPSTAAPPDASPPTL
jgi:cytoskeletal protein CcmA (bactofilin family)